MLSMHPKLEVCNTRPLAKGETQEKHTRRGTNAWRLGKRCDNILQAAVSLRLAGSAHTQQAGKSVSEEAVFGDSTGQTGLATT